MGPLDIDLLNTLRELEGWKVSIIAVNGMTFDLSSPHGMAATFLSGNAEFERDFISERVKLGLAAARTRSKRLGRQIGDRSKGSVAKNSFGLDRALARDAFMLQEP